MAETKNKKIHVKKPPRVKNTKPVRNRCGICEMPCTPEKKSHDGCVNRQKIRAKRVITMAVKQERKAKTTEVVSEEAQIKDAEVKHAAAKAVEAKETDVTKMEGN